MSRDNFSLADAKKLAKARGATLRAEVAGYIREKADAFKPFWLPPPTPEDEASRVNLVQIEGGQPPDTWEAYLKALDRPTRWANDISLRATVKRLNCRIIVAVDDIKNPTQLLAYRKPIDFKDNRKQVVIPLLYREKHYQLIMAKPGKEIPESWRALPVGGHTTVPRGGGGDTWLPPRSASSACSDVEDTGGWLPPRAPSSSARSTPSLGSRARAWLPSRAPSSLAASRAPDGEARFSASVSGKAPSKGIKRKAGSIRASEHTKSARTMATGTGSIAGSVVQSRDSAQASIPTAASVESAWFCSL